MKLLPFSTMAAWSVVLACPMVAGESSARQHGDGVLARGAGMEAARVPTQRNLSPGRSSGGDPSNCCEFIEDLMRLDQYCADAIAALETEIACESFGIISSTSSLPFKAYSKAVNTFDGYLLDYELGVFSDLSGLDCTVDTTGTVNITLVTFGGYCLLGEVIVVDTVNPPVFTYTQTSIPYNVTDLLFTVPAP